MSDTTCCFEHLWDMGGRGWVCVPTGIGGELHTDSHSAASYSGPHSWKQGSSSACLREGTPSRGRVGRSLSLQSFPLQSVAGESLPLTLLRFESSREYLATKIILSGGLSLGDGRLLSRN